MLFVQQTGKKKVRTILGARRVNQHLLPPPGLALCSSESLSRVEIELPRDVDCDSAEGQRILSEFDIFLGNGDAKDAFHRFRLRRSLALRF